jgi:hypothetical protein
MRNYLVPVAALGILLTSTLAIAAEATGVVQSVDEATRTLTLQSGETYTLSEDVTLTDIQPGMQITLVYDEANKVVSEVRAQ